MVAVKTLRAATLLALHGIWAALARLGARGWAASLRARAALADHHAGATGTLPLALRAIALAGFRIDHLAVTTGEQALPLAANRFLELAGGTALPVPVLADGLVARAGAELDFLRAALSLGNAAEASARFCSWAALRGSPAPPAGTGLLFWTTLVTFHAPITGARPLADATDTRFDALPVRAPPLARTTRVEGDAAPIGAFKPVIATGGRLRLPLLALLVLLSLLVCGMQAVRPLPVITPFALLPSGVGALTRADAHDQATEQACRQESRGGAT